MENGTSTLPQVKEYDGVKESHGGAHASPRPCVCVTGLWGLTELIFAEDHTNTRGALVGLRAGSLAGARPCLRTQLRDLLV